MMTIGEFERVSGIDRGTIRYYCNEGLLAPERTGEGKSNNRRLYDEGDLARLQQICIYRKLNLSIRDIHAILDAPDYDASSALNDAIAQVEHEIKHLENVVVLARASQAFGVDAFPFGMYTDESIDAYVDELRKNPGFVYAESLTAKDSEEWRTQERQLYKEFASLSDSASFEDIEKLVDRYCSLYARFDTTNHPMMMFTHAARFVGDGLCHKMAERLGGPGTSEIIVTCITFVWMTRAAKEVIPLINDYYERLLAGEDCVAERERLISWSADYYREELPDLIPNRQIEQREADQEWILSGIYETLGDLLFDEDALVQMGFNKDEMPTKEAWEAAIDVIRQSRKKGDKASQ